MSAGEIGAFAGTILATFLFSRIMLWLMRSWTSGGLIRIVLAHVISLLFTGVAGAHGYDTPPLEAMAGYVIGQAIWLNVDIVLYFRRTRMTATAATAVQQAAAPIMRDMNRHRRT